MAAVNRHRLSRETRFLLVTMIVSVAALLVLARFRFTEREPVGVVAPPLERLAARATYEELAGVVQAARSRIDPLVTVLRIDHPAAQPQSIGELLARPAPLGSLATFIPAVRTEPEAGLAFIPARLSGRDLIVGDESAPVIGSDPLLGVVLVELPAAASGTWSWAVENAVTPGRYVVAVEGSRDGPALRPTFLARADEMPSPGWGQVHLVDQPSPVPEGSLLFSLAGAFTGMVVFHVDTPALVPAATVRAVADRLRQAGQRPAGDLGVEVQALTAPLRQASGTNEGVMVTWVDPAGPAAASLRVGDVVAWLGGMRTPSPAAFLTALAQAGPGSLLSLTVFRAGERVELTLETVAHPLQPPPADPADFGARLESRPGLGALVGSVARGGPAETAGLREGDIVTSFGDRAAPRPADVTRAFARMQPGQLVLAGVLRGSDRLVVAIRR